MQKKGGRKKTTRLLGDMSPQREGGGVTGKNTFAQGKRCK